MQSVVVEKTVYIGGGFALDDKDNRIMTYNTSSEKWSTLPPYRAHNFAMTVISNQLVLVGGSDHLRKIKTLGAWSADSKQWTHPYPDMHVARIHCSAVAYNEWLASPINMKFYHPLKSYISGVSDGMMDLRCQHHGRA